MIRISDLEKWESGEGIVKGIFQGKFRSPGREFGSGRVGKTREEKRKEEKKKECILVGAESIGCRIAMSFDSLPLSNVSIWQQLF